ncbi:MAG: hypothetical protein FMNOHCHN_03645 [Ignavibacteriaceae bacterium]|nr:hypothetical protein [Ignavibacteriaceae bacterium]
MPRLRGKFAPIFEDEINEKEFLIDCDDFEKLIFFLIKLTTQFTRHSAPLDPLYYQKRYGIRARKQRIKDALLTLKKRFPELSVNNKKLSLIKSTTSESQIVPIGGIETEGETEKRKEGEEREKKSIPSGLPPDDSKPQSSKPPAELLRESLFCEMTEADRQKILESYDHAFLSQRLTAYLATAGKKGIRAMRPWAVVSMLEDDAEAHAKANSRQARAKKEKQDWTEQLRTWEAECSSEVPADFLALKKKLGRTA